MKTAIREMEIDRGTTSNISRQSAILQQNIKFNRRSGSRMNSGSSE